VRFHHLEEHGDCDKLLDSRRHLESTGKWPGRDEDTQRGAFGDGGLVTCLDAALAHEVALLGNPGAEPNTYHKRIGGSPGLDALQGAVLRVKLPHLPQWTNGRRANAR
jgi:hypothetical protein